jgi:hypothetical protein
VTVKSPEALAAGINHSAAGPRNGNRQTGSRFRDYSFWSRVEIPPGLLEKVLCWISLIRAVTTVVFFAVSQLLQPDFAQLTAFTSIRLTLRRVLARHSEDRAALGQPSRPQRLQSRHPALPL